MKQFLLSLCIIIILSLSLGTIALFFDNLQVDTSHNDFNIVLITIDALRADHLSCYGYERKTSPNIDKIAEKGFIFKNAVAPSSYTVPSMASLFTSFYPTNHGVLYGRLADIYPDTFKKFETNLNQVIPDELTTLAEILKMHGYTTFGVSSNLLLDEKTGFAKGFDYFEHPHSSPASRVNKTIYSWEDKIKKSDKFFLWVHYLDPHFPYFPRDPWMERYTSKALTEELNLFKKSFKEISKLVPMLKKDPQALSNLIALYDSEINFVDFYVGELIQKFELDKNTFIIITSDHGEEFLEHGNITHGNNLFKETIRIPFIVKLPNRAKKTVKTYVNLVDIMPTILHLLGIDLSEQILGKSFLKKKGLLPWLKKILLRKDTSNYTFAEISKEKVLKTVMTPEWKYIYNYRNKTEQLYNIKSDPLELNNLIDKETKQGNQLKENLFNWVSNLKKYYAKGQPFQLSPEEKEKLKYMGYIQ